MRCSSCPLLEADSRGRCNIRHEGLRHKRDVGLVAILMAASRLTILPCHLGHTMGRSVTKLAVINDNITSSVPLDGVGDGPAVVHEVYLVRLETRISSGSE